MNNTLVNNVLDKLVSQLDDRINLYYRISMSVTNPLEIAEAVASEKALRSFIDYIELVRKDIEVEQ